VNGKWFANRGQIIQTGCAVVGCAIVFFNAYPNLKTFSGWSVLFYVLLVGALVSLFVTIKNLAGTGLSQKVIQDSTTEFENLNQAEKMALRMYLENRRATTEKINNHLAAQGFITPKEDMFSQLDKKTRFMERDFIGPNGVKPEFRRLVSRLLKKSARRMP
jgi:hypothetical protein